MDAIPETAEEKTEKLDSVVALFGLNSWEAEYSCDDSRASGEKLDVIWDRLDTVLRYDVTENNPVSVVLKLEAFREEALGVIIDVVDEAARVELESRVDDAVGVPCNVAVNDGLGRTGGGPRLSVLIISAA